MNIINHKIGDSITWQINYKQSDGTPVDLTGVIIDIDAINQINKEVLFNILSTESDPNSYLTVDEASGIISIVIKDTTTFKIGAYDVDIEFTDSLGFKRSSKSFILKVVVRL